MGPFTDRGDKLFEIGRYEQAAGAYTQQLAHTPNDPLAHAQLALCQSLMDQHRDALESAEQSVALGPDLAFCHHALAIVIYNDFEWQGRRRFGICFTDRQQTAQRLAPAMDAIDEALRLEPEAAPFWLFRGQILNAMQRHREAMDAVTEALNLDPNDAEALVWRGELQAKLGELDASEATLKASLAMHPENAHAHVRYGWTMLRRGRVHDAFDRFREALRLDPTLASAQEGLHHAVQSMNRFYRGMTRFNLWLENLTRPRRWACLAIAMAAVAVLAVGGSRLHPIIPDLIMGLGVLVGLVFAVGYGLGGQRHGPG